MKFRIIDTGVNNGFFNMALDETVMDFVRNGKTLPTVRFYQWSPLCVSLGYFQRLNEINVNNCKKLGINIVRRITGGKAVLHNNELTYSFIAPQTFLPRSIIESYKIIATPILNALYQLGLKVSLTDKKIAIGSSSFCFFEQSYYEININNKKIVGSAQARIKDVLLQHGSIMLDYSPEIFSHIFNTKESNIDKNKIIKRVTSIRHEMQENINLSKLKSLLIENFERSLNIKTIKMKPTEDELLITESLKEKYKDV